MVDEKIKVIESRSYNRSDELGASKSTDSDSSQKSIQAVTDGEGDAAVNAGARESAKAAEIGLKMRSWRLRLRDLPVRHKVSLLVVVSMFVGTLIGDMAGSGWHIWLVVILFIGLLAGLLIGAYRWLADPLLRLVHRLEMLAKAQSTGGVRALPADREDEIGDLARSVKVLCEVAIRDAHEARRLRRTIESLVVKETKRATVQLERLAMRDPLTGLGNRRFMEEQIESLLTACRVGGADLICMLLDVDNFKQVNDQLGHAAGDDILALIGRMLSGSVRPEDVGVRMGGDEFVLFLPDTTPQSAGALSERLRDLLCQQVKRMYPKGPWANLSVGVASLKRDGCENGEELLAMADEHLYAAKRAGKGRTYGAGELANELQG